MMYVANKLCRISGKSYKSGACIEPSALKPYDAMRLKNLGIIYEVPAQTPSEPLYSETEVEKIVEFALMKVTDACNAIAELDKTDDNISFIDSLIRIDKRAKVIEACKQKLTAFETLSD